MSRESPIDAIISAIEGIEETYHDHPKNAAACSTAVQWLRNITDPISKEDDERWFQNCACEEAEYYLEDGRAKELARSCLDPLTPDDIKRDELREFDEQGVQDDTTSE